MAKTLSGIALITGGTGSIGYSFAKSLAEAGVEVVVLGRGKTRPIDETVTALQAETGLNSFHGRAVDISDEAAFSSTLEEIVQNIGTPTILVNAAGGNKGKAPFVDMDVEIFQEVLAMNLVGGLVVPCKHLARLWIAQGVAGSIINIASMTSYIPLSGVWAYGASKSAVINLTQGLAKEFAPHGIRVNGIAPGFFVGNQNRDLLYSDFAKGQLSDRGHSIIERTPFGRFGQVEELNGTLLYLCDSAASGFVTGVTIPVDGGFLVDNI